MDSSRRFTPGVALTSVLPTFRPNSARVIAVAQTLALPRLPELVALRVGWCVSGLPRPVGPAALHAVLPIVLPSNICVNADSGNPQRVPVRRISVSKLCIPVTRISTMLVPHQGFSLAGAIFLRSPQLIQARRLFVIVDIGNQNVGHDHNEHQQRLGESVIPVHHSFSRQHPNARLNNRNESRLYSPTRR